MVQHLIIFIVPILNIVKNFLLLFLKTNELCRWGIFKFNKKTHKDGSETNLIYKFVTPTYQTLMAIHINWINTKMNIIPVSSYNKLQTYKSKMN